MFSSYISVPPPPVLLMLLPLLCALLILGLGGLNFILRFKASGAKAFRLGRIPLKIIFLSAVTVETALSIYVWQTFQSVGSSSYTLNYPGWTALIGLGGLAVRASVRIDIFSASSAALTSLVAFAACLRALADNENKLTQKKAVYFLLTLCGVMGVYFSGGLVNIFLSIALSQIGASGLARPVLHERAVFGRTVAYFISRLTLLLMLFAGCAILALRYDTFSLDVMSLALRSESAEKAAFALLAAPLLYLFIKPPYYTADSASRCYFAIRAHAAFFAFFKIVFIVYGAMSGLERMPALIGVIGLITVFAALLFASGEREPIKYATAIESSLKGFMLVALAMCLSAAYSVESIAGYGYSAVEAVISLWLLFLPASAVLSITAVHLRQESGGQKLWLGGGQMSRLPLTGLLFAFAVCMLGGLPPFLGYSGRQLLYRSANLINPFLTLALFMASMFVLFTGLRYIFTILFGKRNYDRDAQFSGDSPIRLPLVVLLLIITSATIMPGHFYEKLVSPSVSFLLNGIRHSGGGNFSDEQDTAAQEEGAEPGPAAENGEQGDESATED